MNTFVVILDRINSMVWGPPLLILMVVVGVYLTIKIKALQVRKLWYAQKLALFRHDDGAAGDISHFQALMTALAGTIGIGSITGVATAITVGGLGSLFWMWVAAFLGMATKYAEAILAIKYRIVDENGEMSGGPMYYLERGLKNKPLAILFAGLAAITALGTGNMIQANSVALAIKEIVPISPLWVGFVLILAIGFPLIKGIKSIGKVAGVIVPGMAVFYFISCLIILCINIEKIPGAFAIIFSSAFTGQAATGGFLGSTMMLAIQMGVSRGVFSSEAGLGTSPIAAAAAKTDSPGRQALVSMSTVFITTGIVCTLTGLVIATTNVLGLMNPDGTLLDGSALALRAFNEVIPGGSYIITLSLIFFAYSTILGWAYYGEKCTEYLFGFRSVVYYRILYTLVILPGSMLDLKVIWGIANILNGLMAFPNLIGIFLLTPVVAAETKLFEKILDEEKQDAELSKS